jgi:hypothetical protein
MLLFTETLLPPIKFGVLEVEVGCCCARKQCTAAKGHGTHVTSNGSHAQLGACIWPRTCAARSPVRPCHMACGPMKHVGYGTCFKLQHYLVEAKITLKNEKGLN